MLKFAELNETISLAEQMTEEADPMFLVNVLTVGAATLTGFSPLGMATPKT